MKPSTLLTIAAALVSAEAFDMGMLKRPTVEDAAVYARTLINRESLANVNTVYQDGDEEGLPVSFVEYYADCGDGNPVILAVDMGSSFKNVEKGSSATLSVRVGDHTPQEHVSPEYPGSRPYSVAGSPRINLRGKFVEVAEEETPALEQCFLQRHKDAAWWLPGNPIHSSHWVKFEVEDAYFLGGFGDTGYIGKIPKELYQSATVLEKPGFKSKKHHKGEFKKDGFKPKHHQEVPHRDLGVDAIALKHSVKSYAKTYFGKIESQLDTLSAALNAEEKSDDLVIPLEDHNQSLWDLVKSQLQKKDVTEVPSEINLKELTKEQLEAMVSELESLKTKLHDYTEALYEKYDLKKVEDEFKPKEKHFKHKGHKGEFKSKSEEEESDVESDEEDFRPRKHHKGDFKPHHFKHNNEDKPQGFFSKLFAWGEEKPKHPWHLKEKLEKGEISQEEFKAAKAEIYKYKKAGIHGENKPESGHPWDLLGKLERGEITQKEFRDAKAEIYKNKKEAHSKEDKPSHPWNLKEKLENGEISEQEFKDAKADIYKYKKAGIHGENKPESRHPWGLLEKLEKGEITDKEFRDAKAEIYKKKKADAKASEEKPAHPWHLKDKLDAGEITEEEFNAAKKEIYKYKNAGISGEHKPESRHPWGLLEKLEKGEITQKEFQDAKAEIYKNKKAEAEAKGEKPSHPWHLKEKLEKGEISEQEFKDAKAEIYKYKKNGISAENAPESRHPWGLLEKLEKGEITQKEFQDAKAEIYKNKKAEAKAQGEKPTGDHPWGLKEKLEKGEITEDEFKAAKAEIYKNKKAEAHKSEKKAKEEKPHGKFRAKELREKAQKHGKKPEFKKSDFEPKQEQSVLSAVLSFFGKVN